MTNGEFVPIPDNNRPQPQTTRLILSSLGSNPGGSDVVPTQQWYKPPSNPPSTLFPTLPIGNNQDDTSRIQSALDAAGTDETVKLYGSYITSATLVVKGHLDASSATINYSGGSVAVRIGTGSVLSRKNIKLPFILCTTKPSSGNGWNVGSIGLEVLNTQSSFVFIPHIRNFEIGLKILSNAQGNVYNHYFLGHLDNNKINLWLGSITGSGWTNENTFYGGRFSLNTGEGTAIAGSAQIFMDNTYGPNNNRFIGCSLESTGPHEWIIDAQGGNYNKWIGCRWEVPGGASVRWGATTVYNEIDGGYSAHLISETRVAGASRNRVRSLRGDKWFSGGGTNTEGLILENTTSSGNPVLRIMTAGDDGNFVDPETAWRWKHTANNLFGKAASDTVERLKLSNADGRIYLGPGGSTSPIGFIDATANLVRIGGSVGFRVSPFATGSRPSATTLGQGAMIFDTTLNKPIWSDGTNWRDAVGTVV